MKYPFSHRYAVTLMNTGEAERGLTLLDENREQLEKVIESGQHLHANKGAYYDLATIYAMLGRKQAAVDMLHLAKDKESEGAFFSRPWLVADTMLDPIRDFPPFVEFMDELRRQDDATIGANRRLFREELAKRQAEGRLVWLKTD